MKNIKRKLAKFMTATLLINSVFSGTYANTFASVTTQTNTISNATAKSTGVSFDWQKNLSLTDTLTTTTRASNDEVFLTWQFGTLNGTAINTGTYELTYNIDDKKQVKFSIEKKNDVAEVTYSICDNDKGDYSNKVEDSYGYQVYKNDTGNYITPSLTSYPPISENFKIHYDNGTASEVKFSIAMGNGFSFKYRNNTIRFKWDSSGLFYFSTNGVKQGNIYDFNLKLTGVTADEIQSSLQIFTGINTSTLQVTPKANGGQTTIDQTSRPISEYPGEKPEIEVEFDMPKVWDDKTKTYVFETADTSKTEVVFDLSQVDATQRTTIKIEDIYEDFTNAGTAKLAVSSSNSAFTVTATREKNEKVKLVISGLDAGIIYNPVKIDVARQEGTFLTKTLDIEIGKFYTYPKFSVVSLGESEFYIKIEPFKGYNGYYTVYSGNTSSTLAKWATHEENNLGAESILIPINLSALNPQEKYFKVEFSLSPSDDTSVSTSQVFSSQILKYKPDKADVILGTPTNFEVLDSTVIYNPITEKNELIAEFKWDIGYSNILEYLISNNKDNPVDITYTFYKGNTPATATEREFAKIKVTIAKDSDGNIEVTKIEEVGGNKYLKDFSISTSNTIVGSDRLTVISPSVTFSFPVSSAQENNETFSYPSINFISIRGEYTTGTQTITTSASSSVNITIDDVLVVEIPQPQNINVTSIDKQSFNVTFSTMSWDDNNSILYDYRTRILEKVGLTLKDGSVKYDFYITQDKALLDNLIKGEDISESIKTFDYKNEPLGEFDFSSVSTANKTMRQWLRENSIVQIQNVLQADLNSALQTMSLKGLDKNQTYYVVVKAFVTPYEVESGDRKEKYTDESKFSTIVTATTLVDEDVPSEEEKQPSAPTNFTKDNVTLSSANLIWDRVQETNNNSTLEYQFIRVQGQQLDDEFLNSTDSFKNTWDNISSASKFGFRTSGVEVQTYSETDNSFNTASSNNFQYVSAFGDKGNILDKTLRPNTIYFYYIRTVRVVNGTDIAYSVWVPLTLTTSKIAAPQNLKVEKDSNKDIDTTTEAVISFELANISKEDLLNKYKVELFIKKDNENWSNSYNIDLTKATIVENENGITKVSYTIKNLEHSSFYTIRTKLYSIELDSTSDYSNEATHRTDTDTSKNEYDYTVNEWKENYKSLLEQLINQDFWFITNNLSTTSVVYRPGHIDNIINSTNSSIIELQAGLDGVKKEYYIPASEVQKVLAANKGFKISFKDTDVILSSSSINLTGNSALTSALEAIETGQAKDYFVKISVTFNEGTYVIDGSNNISPSVDISLQIIGTSKTISEWDTYMLQTLNKLLDESYTEDLNDYIEKAIENEYKDDQTVLGINNILDKLKSDFGTKLSSQITGITKRAFYVESLNGNIIIAQLADSQTSVTGYTLENYIWKSVTTSEYGNKKAIYTNKPGTYIFVGTKLVISGIENIENGTLITQIITKYSLEDYLGKGGIISLSGNLTRNAVIGIAARVSGATRTQDPITYFKNKGITLSNRNLDSNITTQEAIFLLMQIYEARTNTKIETVKITNYSLTSGITGLNSSYKKAVQVAFQTGIYTNQNISANGSITAQEFLQSLARLISKVGL